jgi:putative hemolysin
MNGTLPDFSATLLSSLPLIGLFALSAGLHAAQGALSGLHKARLEELQEQEDPRAPKLALLYSHMTTYYAICEIGIQVTRVLIILLAWALGWSLASSWNLPWARWTFAAFTALLLAFVHFLLMDVFLRNLGRKKPESFSAKLYPFLRVLRYLLFPVTLPAISISQFLSKRFQIGPLFSPHVLTEEELLEIVEASDESTGLIEDEKEMISSIMEFTDTVAREVMTPRTDIVAAEASATPQEIARLIEQSGHTRIPIYQDNIDHIIGIVHAKDLLKALVDGSTQDIRSILRPALFIPENKDLHSLLSAFRSGKTQMAIVQDEYGGTSGLVTVEDVVEEIVGEIVDEYDTEIPTIQPLGDNAWLVHGRMHLEDVNDEIGTHFESEQFDTIGGYVFGLFGRQPQVNESVESNGWVLTVTETDGRRIQRVHIRKKNSHP